MIAASVDTAHEDRLNYVLSLSPRQVKTIKAAIKVLSNAGFTRYIATMLVIDAHTSKTLK